MAMTAADVLVEALMDWGVDVVFGMSGDGIDGVMEALRHKQLLDELSRLSKSSINPLPAI